MSERKSDYWEAANTINPATTRRRSKAEQVQEIGTTIEIEESKISDLFPESVKIEGQE